MVLMSESAKVLSGVPFFASFDPNALELIHSATLQQTFDAGEYLFMEGEPCIGLYVVEEGWLRAVKISAAGREQVIRFVGPGDIFNEVGVLAGGVNMVTVEALEPARILIIQREVLLDLIEQYPMLAKSLVENLANRVLHAMNLIVDLSLHPVESRLARFLLEQASGEYIYRKSWATQAAIAARLGTVPVVINRAFRALVEGNLIDLERNRIHILDRAALQRIASGSL
jgi:CRP/FNR family transcriptional regulator